MSINFTKTTVLSSGDGLDFDQEERIAEKSSASGAGSLYDQINQNKKLAQDEYDATGDALRGPPEALDEADVEYFDSVYKKKRVAQMELERAEEDAIDAFRNRQQDLEQDSHWQQDESTTRTSTSLVANVLQSAKQNTSVSLASSTAEKKKKKKTIAITKRKRSGLSQEERNSEKKTDIDSTAVVICDTTTKEPKKGDSSTADDAQESKKVIKSAESTEKKGTTGLSSLAAYSDSDSN